MYKEQKEKDPIAIRCDATKMSNEQNDDKKTLSNENKEGGRIQLITTKSNCPAKPGG